MNITMLLLDVSPSVNYEHLRTEAILKAKRELLQGNTTVGAVQFSAHNKMVCMPTDDLFLLSSNIYHVQISQTGTFTPSAIKATVDGMIDMDNANNKKIVILTDNPMTVDGVSYAFKHGIGVEMISINHLTFNQPHPVNINEILTV